MNITMLGTGNALVITDVITPVFVLQERKLGIYMVDGGGGSAAFYSI